jgi:predicted nuclease of predicted toxin-antitoxin system
MNIFVDENIPTITVQTLRESGHKVEDIRGTPDEGIPDEQVWELAQKKKCLLITTDKGFSQYRNESHHGILIVRLGKPNQDRIHQRIMRAIEQFKDRKWKGRLVVMRDSVQSVFKSKS